MSQKMWGNKDIANNSPIWATNQVGHVADTGTANSTNQAHLYNNATMNAFTVGLKTGTFAVSPTEMVDSLGGVANVTVTAAGTGFTVRPTVSFTPAGTTNATATATAKVVAFTLGGGAGAGGQDYAVNDVVTIATTGAAGASTSAKANILTVNATGGVLTMSINAAGSFTTLPTAIANNAPTGGNGTNLRVNLAFGVNSVTVTGNGTGYQVAPTVVFAGTGGTGATATAQITSEQRRVTSAGWVLRSEDKNGRVRTETLVAMKSFAAANTSDDSYFPQ